MKSLFAAAAALAFALSSMHAQAQGLPTQYPIKADDGTIIANHRITAELEDQIEKLQNVVVAANPKGKVTLYEFYDLNCPYCRKASSDIAELVRGNPELRLVLVPFPVLGIPSILAARVEYAVARLASASDFYKFHHLVYAGRGVIDDKRAFEAAPQCVSLHQGDGFQIGAIQMQGIQKQGADAGLRIFAQVLAVTRLDQLAKQIEVASQIVDPGMAGGHHYIIHVGAFRIVHTSGHVTEPIDNLPQQGPRETGARRGVHVAPGNLIVLVVIRRKLTVIVLLWLQSGPYSLQVRHDAFSTRTLIGHATNFRHVSRD